MTEPERRLRYEQVRLQWPALFANPSDAPYTIIFDPSLVSAAEAEEANRLRARRMPDSWALTGVMYEDPYMLVVRDAVRRPDGQLGTYVRTLPASGAAGAAVLPIIGDQIVLVRHFRHATRGWHLEIPRGYGEHGVAMEEQARQELSEEIGAKVDTLVKLGGFHSNNGVASDCVVLFLAKIHEVGMPQTDEGIERIVFRSVREVADLIAAEEIDDSFTIGAFARATVRGLLPRAQGG